MSLNIRPDIAALEESQIVEVWRMGFDIPDVIGMWVGQGDLPTPRFICDAASNALAGGDTFYTHKRGIPELRQALIDYHRDLYGVEIADSRIAVTSSGMNAMMLIAQGLALVISGTAPIYFTEVSGAGSVANSGNITTPQGGNVYLVGPAVMNNGIITSPKGEVVLAAGDSVELVNPGTPNLRVEITAPDNEARNLGQSGVSKERDYAIAHEVLRAYGDLVKGAMKDTLRAAIAARGDDADLAVDVKGLDRFDIRDLSSELEDAARVDGCRPLGILTRINLPLIAPSLAATAVIAFFSGWNEYVFAVTFAFSPEIQPASVGLASFIGELCREWSIPYPRRICFHDRDYVRYSCRGNT